MECIVSITAQSPLQEKTWTNQNGEAKKLHIVTLTMTDGIDTMLADAMDDLADTLVKNPAKTGMLYKVVCQMNVRTWNGEKGERQSNSIRLLRMNPVIPEAF